MARAKPGPKFRDLRIGQTFRLSPGGPVLTKSSRGACVQPDRSTAKCEPTASVIPEPDPPAADAYDPAKGDYLHARGTFGQWIRLTDYDPATNSFACLMALRGSAVACIQTDKHVDHLAAWVPVAADGVPAWVAERLAAPVGSPWVPESDDDQPPGGPVIDGVRHPHPAEDADPVAAGPPTTEQMVDRAAAAMDPLLLGDDSAGLIPPDPRVEAVAAAADALMAGTRGELGWSAAAAGAVERAVGLRGAAALAQAMVGRIGLAIARQEEPNG